jgi:hypothetical protein
MTRNELINKLGMLADGAEAADKEVAKHCGIAWSPDEDGNFGGYGILPKRCHFTRSLDAALTLAPFRRGRIKLVMPDGVRHGAFIQDADFPGVWHTGHGATPALALCIAALKATSA